MCPTRWARGPPRRNRRAADGVRRRRVDARGPPRHSTPTVHSPPATGSAPRRSSSKTPALRTVRLTSDDAVVAGLPAPVDRWHVAPPQAAPGTPEHLVDHHAVIGATASPAQCLIGQQRLLPGPRRISQVMRIKHQDGLPHPTDRDDPRDTLQWRWVDLMLDDKRRCVSMAERPPHPPSFRPSVGWTAVRLVARRAAALHR